MTTTQKMLLRKAEINRKSKKAMRFIIVGTIILFSLAVYIGINCHAIFITY